MAQTPATTNEEDFTLFNLTDVDRATLRQTDEEFIPHNWEELKRIVGTIPSPPSSHKPNFQSRLPRFLRIRGLQSSLTLPLSTSKQ